MAQKTRKNLKKNIWTQFDEFNSIEDKLNSSDIKTHELDLCANCDSILHLNLDGFYICSNPSCGRINLSILDQSAEWRFYGGDDNSSQDPTNVNAY